MTACPCLRPDLAPWGHGPESPVTCVWPPVPKAELEAPGVALSYLLRLDRALRWHQDVRIIWALHFEGLVLPLLPAQSSH